MLYLKASKIALLYLLCLLLAACSPAAETGLTNDIKENNLLEAVPATEDKLLAENGDNQLEHAEQTKQQKDENAASDEPTAAENDLPVLSEPLKLFLELKPISRKDYLDRYGSQSLDADPVTTVAEKIAFVVINPQIIIPDSLKDGSNIIINLFEGQTLTAVLDHVSYSDTSLSFSGLIIGQPGSSLTFSITNQQALGSIRLPEQNQLCLIKYNSQGGIHYLFMAKITELQIPVDEPAPVRPEHNLSKE